MSTTVGVLAAFCAGTVVDRRAMSTTVGILGAFSVGTVVGRRAR